jgi:large subunit ribosomal protein L34
MSKHTNNGTKKKAIKVSGFRARMSTKNGKKVIQRRRKKLRWKLSLK